MSPVIMILAAAAVTYFWRAAGALTAGKISVHSPIFKLASCITYAMVAALILRMIVYPAGGIMEIPLVLRFAALAVGLGVYFASRKNVAAAAWSSVIMIIIFNAVWGNS